MASQTRSAGSISGGWSNDTNAVASDDAYASKSIPLGSYAQGYSASHGFSIPTDATINGVEVSIEGKATYVECYLSYLRLYSGGANITSTGPDSSASWYPSTSDTTTTQGGATDMWGGSSITPAMVNAADFGARFRIQDNTGLHTNTMYVDHVSITVHYTAAASPIDPLFFGGGL